MKTALHDRHHSLGAKIVDFNGWQMPLHYKGVLHEHHAVRKGAGIFDVSHMGRILVKGPDAEQFLEYLSTNRIANKPDGTATYTVWANKDGGSVDDVIVYRNAKDDFFVVVNAGNREKDLLHMTNEASRFNVTIETRYDDDGILAIQGPEADTIIHKLFPEAATLCPFQFVNLQYNGFPVVVSKTGYTGAGGTEIYAPHAAITALWDHLFEVGKDINIEPIGLGARDTLRLEMGYALYGHELSDSIAANESVSGWTVKFDKEDFLGKEALQKIESSGLKRNQYGVVMEDKGIPRANYEVQIQGKPVGIVTSGTLSPTLNKGIALIMSQQQLKEGDSVDVMIRNIPCKAKVSRLPFLQQTEKEK